MIPGWLKEWWHKQLHPSALPEPEPGHELEGAFGIPVFSQGTPAPAFLPRHHYGASGTIHQTGTIDVQVDWERREVIAVWFRCLNLPFTVSPAFENELPVQPNIAIEDITYVELPDDAV